MKQTARGYKIVLNPPSSFHGELLSKRFNNALHINSRLVNIIHKKRLYRWWPIIKCFILLYIMS